MARSVGRKQSGIPDRCPLLNTDSTRAAQPGSSHLQHTYFQRISNTAVWHEGCTFLPVIEEVSLKTLSIIALLIAGLPMWGKAEENSTGANDTGFVEMQLQKPDIKDGGTITVDVWSPATSAKDQSQTKLSSSFAMAGLTAASRMQNTERRMEQSIKRGFPLGEFWIRLDFDGIDESLRVASLAARNDADRQALQELQSQVGRLRSWSDWLIQQNKELRLADYYISPAKLDNDEQFQASVSCTNFMLSMMASGELQEQDRSCR